ncbi:MAG: hypothetical protein ACJ8J0_01230 [Longimicrobiaceae bacterium]
MKKLGIFALAAVAALAACKKENSDNTVVTDSAAVASDSNGTMAAPPMTAPTPADSSMNMPAPTDSGAMTDSMATDTTKKM